MLRHLTMLATTASCLTPGFALAAESERDRIDVGRLELEPQATEGSLRWHPYLLIGGGYDTNPRQRNEDDDDGDSWILGLGGVQLDWDSPNAALRTSAEVGMRDHQEVDEEDQILIHGDLDWEDRGRLSGYAIDLDFDQDQRPDTATAIDAERRDYAAAGTWWREGRFRWVRVQGGIRVRDYADDGDPRNRNQDFLQARALADYLPLGETDRRWGGLARLTWTSYTREDSLAQDGLGLELLANWLRELDQTSRLLLRAGVAVGWYQDDFAEDADYGDSVVAWPAGEIAWRHDLGPKGSRLALEASSGLLPGERSNARGFVATTTRAILRPALHWRFDGEAEVAYRRDSGADAGVDPVTQTTGSIDVGASYLMNPACSIRLGYRYRQTWSNDDVYAYDQHEIGLDAAAAF